MTIWGLLWVGFQCPYPFSLSSCLSRPLSFLCSLSPFSVPVRLSGRLCLRTVRFGLDRPQPLLDYDSYMSYFEYFMYSPPFPPLFLLCATSLSAFPLPIKATTLVSPQHVWHVNASQHKTFGIYRQLMREYHRSSLWVPTRCVSIYKGYIFLWETLIRNLLVYISH